MRKSAEGCGEGAEACGGREGVGGGVREGAGGEARDEALVRRVEQLRRRGVPVCILPPRADGATRGVEDAHVVVVHPARVQAARHVHEPRADYVPVVDERREAVCDVAVLLRARLAVLEVVLIRLRYAGVPIAQLR